MVTIFSTVRPYGMSVIIPPPQPSQPPEQRHSSYITPPNIKCLNRTTS